MAKLNLLYKTDYGKDLKKSYGEIKMKIGVCPQTDLCFPYLSCEENLEIIAAIRGIPKKDIPKEVEIQLKKVSRNFIYLI